MVKAICVPPGDHAGAHSVAVLVVSCSISEPDGEMEYRSRS